MNDTCPEIEDKVRDMMRQKSPYERLRMASSMYDTAKHLATCGILKDNPNISRLDLQQELFVRFYGQDFTPIKLEKILQYFKDRLWIQKGRSMK